MFRCTYEWKHILHKDEAYIRIFWIGIIITGSIIWPILMKKYKFYDKQLFFF